MTNDINKPTVTVNAAGAGIKTTYKMEGNKIVEITSKKNIQQVNKEVQGFFDKQKQQHQSFKDAKEPYIMSVWAPSILTVKSPVYYIQSQGYYLCLDAGKVLFLKKNDKGNVGSLLPTILRHPLNGQCGSGKNSIKQSVENLNPNNTNAYSREVGAELSQIEMDNIIKGKPSVQALLDVYDQYSNDTIALDISKAIPIW